MANHKMLTIGMCSSMFSEINGTAKASRQLAFALAKYGHKLHIYAPNKPLNWERQKSTFKQQMVYHEFFAFKPPYSQEFNLPMPVIEIFTSPFRKERNEIDIIHVQTPCGMGFFGWGFAKYIHVPKVITAHSPLFFYTKDIFGPYVSALINRMFLVYEPLFYNQFDLRVAPTLSKKEFILYQGFKNPIISLSNGIEDYYFRRGHPEKVREKYNLENKKVLLYLSRLAPEKNQDVILRAFHEIHQQHPDSHFLIAGQGPLRPVLEQMIREFHLEDAVTLVGFVPDEEVLDYYAAADVTCLWSKVEAQGLVLLEAMAQGTPSIGLNAMGIKDVIINGKTGFLVNSESEFIARTVQLFHNEALAQELRRNCFKEIERHRMQNIVNGWTQIYHQLIELYPRISAQQIGADYCEIWQHLINENPHLFN